MFNFTLKDRLDVALFLYSGSFGLHKNTRTLQHHSHWETEAVNFFSPNLNLQVFSQIGLGDQYVIRALCW